MIVHILPRKIQGCNQLLTYKVLQLTNGKRQKFRRRLFFHICTTSQSHHEAGVKVALKVLENYRQMTLIWNEKHVCRGDLQRYETI